MHEEIFKNAILEYTGWAGNSISSISVVADPHVEGTYAIRTQKIGRTEPDYWFLSGFRKGMTPTQTADLLEEAEFQTWPPKAGTLY